MSKSERTRARILQSAVDLFEAPGGGDVRLKDIADRAGVAIPSVLFHFGSRLDLLREVAAVIAAKLRGHWPAPPVPGGTVAVLETFLQARGTAASRAIWRVGDEIAWEMPEATEGVADALQEWVAGHLEADTWSPAEARTLASVLAPAVFMTARRLEVGRAPEAIAAEFLTSVSSILECRRPR